MNTLNLENFQVISNEISVIANSIGTHLQSYNLSTFRETLKSVIWKLEALRENELKSLNPYLEVMLRNVIMGVKNLSEDIDLLKSFSKHVVNTVDSDSDSSMKILNFTELPTHINLKTIIGHEYTKQKLYENIILRFSLDKEIRDTIFSGIRKLIGNVLLYGPPGCGKTLLVQATANECKANLITIRPSDVLSKYQGESEKYIRSIFEEVSKQNCHCIIFFDEFDSIAMSRGSSDDCIQSRRLLSEILQIMSIMRNNDQSINYIVVACTNRLEDLDEAVIRRFDVRSFVGSPSANDRKLLIKQYMENIDCDLSDDDVDQISLKTEGWSGSDIEILCREASMIPMRGVFHFMNTSKSDIQKLYEFTTIKRVSKTEFDCAISELLRETEVTNHDTTLLNN